MQKFLAYFIIICLISCGFFLTLFPYPTFYFQTNQLSLQDISSINSKNQFETFDFRPTQVASLSILNWNDCVNNLFEYDKTFQVYDIDSKLQFFITRIGGVNHADVVAANQDSENLLTTLFTAEKKRTVVIELYKNIWTIASLGKNNSQQHYCMYFIGSKSNSTMLKDKFQENNIKKAFKKARSLPPFTYDN